MWSFQSLCHVFDVVSQMKMRLWSDMSIQSITLRLPGWCGGEGGVLVPLGRNLRVCCGRWKGIFRVKKNNTISWLVNRNLVRLRLFKRDVRNSTIIRGLFVWDEKGRIVKHDNNFIAILGMYKNHNNNFQFFIDSYFQINTSLGYPIHLQALKMFFPIHNSPLTVTSILNSNGFSQFRSKPKPKSCAVGCADVAGWLVTDDCWWFVAYLWFLVSTYH